MNTAIRAIPVITLGLLFVLGGCSIEDDTDDDLDEALATAPTVEVNFSFGQKTFGEYDYEFVDATMRGTIEREDGSTGEYAVPIKLAYPVGGGNDVAVVDLISTALWVETAQALAGNPHTCARGENFFDCPDDVEGDSSGRRAEAHQVPVGRLSTGGYLLREGYTYLALQWDKAALETLGPEPPDGSSRRRLSDGTIEEADDRLGIIQDASRWLRDPSDPGGDVAPQADPPANEYVVGFGFSQPGTMIPNLIHDGINESEDGLLYDGFIPSGVGGNCRNFIEEFPYHETLPCFLLDIDPWATGDAKVIKVETQTDLEFNFFFGPFGRDPGEEDPDVEPNPNFRMWEVAGTSHLPSGIIDVSAFGGENPLRTDFGPVVRAAFYHLTNWIKDDVDPPPSALIEGEVEDDPEAENFGALYTEVDDDGNTLGGVRLPHLLRELDDGTGVGAPVGVYHGTAWQHVEAEPPNLPAAIAGTFERFSNEKLAARYPTREDYLERYEAALDDVIVEGYVLEDDRGRLLARAGEVDIPQAPEATDLPDATEECIGHACPEESGIDLPEGGVVRLELVHQSDWGPEVRTSAWFAGDQAPDARPFPRPPEHWHIQDGDDLCRDLREGDFFPGGDVERRTYLDAGESVELATDGDAISLPRVENGQDDATWQWHNILYRDHIPAGDVAVGADYDIAIAGGEDLPATTYEDALRLPEGFQPAFPDMDDLVIMPAGRDFRFLAEDRPDPDAFDYTFVGFADKFGPVGLCIGPPSQHITVPADFLEAMPPGGVVQFGFLNHRVEERDGRRIDFVGVNSHEARYLIDDEYLQGVNPD